MATANDDLVQGGAGDETLYGYAGNDTINALQGADLLYGGIGDDSLHSGSGDDTVSGAAGNDILINDGGNDLLYGGLGDDRFWLGDVVYGSSGTAWGGDGDDSFVVTTTGTIYGGTGTDTLVLAWGYASLNHAVTLNFAAALATSANGLAMTWRGIERLMLTTGNAADSLVGGGGDDYFTVGAGHNRVSAGAGNDTVSYSITGPNTLDGGAGDDVLLAQNPNSPLYFIIDGLTGRVDDGNLSQITGFERYDARGGRFADITGLGSGNDTFRGDLGDDTAFGAAGDDLLFGDRHTDDLFGGLGNDTLYGGAHGDHLYGGDGNDIVNGGHDSDTLEGGAGTDYFVFGYVENGLDLITDFTSGEDVIRYAAAQLGPLAPGPGRLDPSELQNGGALNTPGIFVTQYNSTSNRTELFWTDNGFGAFLLMQFEGQITLTASDISLF